METHSVMSDEELRLAIDQAWEHTRRTPPNFGLREAREHLQFLREAQAHRANLFTVEDSDGDH